MTKNSKLNQRINSLVKSVYTEDIVASELENEIKDIVISALDGIKKRNWQNVLLAEDIEMIKEELKDE